MEVIELLYERVVRMDKNDKTCYDLRNIDSKMRHDDLQERFMHN